jgi:hypothetical protein
MSKLGKHLTRQAWWFLFGAVAVAIVVYVIVWTTLACHAPEWRATFNGVPSCAEFWLNRYQGLIGALATLLAGFLAYRAAMSVAKSAERQARDARRAALTDQIERLSHDVDALNVAARYLGAYLAQYPSEGGDETTYFRAFRLARLKGSDVISPAALTAPDGYGVRINASMTKLQRLGERTDSLTSDQLSTVKIVGGEIYNVIGELRSIEIQIDLVTPRYAARLRTLHDELKTIAEN